MPGWTHGGTRPAGMPVVSRDTEPGAGAQLSPGEEEPCSIHASSSRALGWAGGEQEAARAVFWDQWRRGVAGLGYTGLCFESSSCWCRAVHWRIGVRLSEGPQECQGLPRHLQTPVHPTASFPSEGRGCSGFAVSWAVPQGSGKLAEGGSILRAGGPAALHQLGEAGRAALGVRELRLS